MKRFVMFMGLPASGKTYHRRYYPHFKVVSSDDIRRKQFGVQFDRSIEHLVWAKVDKTLSRLMRLGKDCLLDATNLVAIHREHYVRMARWHGYSTKAVVFNTPYEVCLERDLKRKWSVGKDVIDMMRENWDKVRVAELLKQFDKVEIVNAHKKKRKEKSLRRVYNRSRPSLPLDINDHSPDDP